MRRFPVEFCELQEFHDVNAALARFALRQKGMRKAQMLGNFALIEAGFLSGCDQSLKDCIIFSLKGRRPRFARPASLGFDRLAHLSSLGNALPYPLIRDKLERAVEVAVADGFFECPELAGKTIYAVRVYENSDQGNEVVIDFTDGTAFSCSLETKCAISAVHFRPSDGNPEVLRSYRP